MGFAIASEAARRGARVMVVAGPVSQPDPGGVEVVHVQTAAEMAEAVRKTDQNVRAQFAPS